MASNKLARSGHTLGYAGRQKKRERKRERKKKGTEGEKEKEKVGKDRK